MGRMTPTGVALMMILAGFGWNHAATRSLSEASEKKEKGANQLEHLKEVGDSAASARQDLLQREFLKQARLQTEERRRLVHEQHKETLSPEQRAEAEKAERSWKISVKTRDSLNVWHMEQIRKVLRKRIEENRHALERG